MVMMVWDVLTVHVNTFCKAMQGNCLRNQREQLAFNQLVLCDPQPRSLLAGHFTSKSSPVRRASARCV